MYFVRQDLSDLIAGPFTAPFSLRSEAISPSLRCHARARTGDVRFEAEAERRRPGHEAAALRRVVAVVVVAPVSAIRLEERELHTLRHALIDHGR